MARYLVIHTPPSDDDTTLRPPSRLLELAQAAGGEDANPRWLKTWSPDLKDDRIFSLWEAESAAEIDQVLQQYGFLDNLSAEPIHVREWGPTDVLKHQ